MWKFESYICLFYGLSAVENELDRPAHVNFNLSIASTDFKVDCILKSKRRTIAATLHESKRIAHCARLNFVSKLTMHGLLVASTLRWFISFLDTFTIPVSNIYAEAKYYVTFQGFLIQVFRINEDCNWRHQVDTDSAWRIRKPLSTLFSLNILQVRIIIIWSQVIWLEDSAER